MLLGIAEDFTTDNVTLDSQLTTITGGGLYLNSGTHPSITLRNLLAFLPDIDITFDTYDNSKTYNVYETSRSREDIVTDGTDLYQCIQTSTGNPTSDTDYWLKTNIDSLRLKNFIYQVKDRVITELNLQKRLIDNQYLYSIGDSAYTPTEDYFGWAIQPKNSDYVRLTVNQMAIQATTPAALDVYVVNQGQLIDTISVSATNSVSFQEVDYSFYGKGIFYFLVDPVEVKKDDTFIDICRYDGFQAYTVTAQGSSFSDLDYTINSSDNGIGLNLTATLDSSVYVQNNLSYLAKFVRTTFELMTFELFLNNSNSRSNVDERQQNRKMYITELKDTKSDTIIKRFYAERKKAFNAMEKTFDSHLSDSDELEITTTSL